MTTQWNIRLFLFVPFAANTAGNRQALVNCLINGGCMESAANELKMFNSVVRLSLLGAEPATAFAIDIPVKPSMRDCLEPFIAGISQAFYFALAAVELPQHGAGQLIKTNRVPAQTRIDDGRPFTFADACGYLQNLKIIPLAGEI